MDNVTHALAGALIAAATVAIVERRHARDASRPQVATALSSGSPALEASEESAPGVSTPSKARFRATAFVVGVLTAELPDADLLYSGPVLGIGNLGYLLHHRGHTHTVVFALVAAAVVWGLALLVRAELRGSPWRWPLLGLATVGTLSHLALDFTNSYGVHPFWPIDNRWFYGDAVFIVEPWLWIVALPPLLLLATRRWTRVLMAFLLAAIVTATWTVGMVGREVAIAITVAAALWYVAARAMRPDRRALYGIGAWALVETVFFASAAAARNEVHAATMDSTRRDVVLTPAVGNPLCFNAIVVELDGGTYRSTAATVAAFPAIREVSGCTGQRAASPGDSRARVRAGTRAVAWSDGWEAPHADLLRIVATRCEARAAMEFIRVPQWEAADGDSILLFDRRYGERGFSGITTPAAGGMCPAHVPGWVPPRADILGAALQTGAPTDDAPGADPALRP